MADPLTSERLDPFRRKAPPIVPDFVPASAIPPSGVSLNDIVNKCSQFSGILEQKLVPMVVQT